MEKISLFWPEGEPANWVSASSGPEKTLRRCVIAEKRTNESQGVGGSVLILANADPDVVIESCTIANNTGRIAGILMYYSTLYRPSAGSDANSDSLNLLVRNSIIWGNNAVMGVTVIPEGIAEYAVNYSDVTYNPPPAHEYYGEGTVSVDPLFADPENGDYRLLPGSPCIDTGDPAMTDPDGSRIDMGAIPFGRPFTRAERVFPFEVGQQYQFRAATSFRRPSGHSLPAWQTAEITVTDTVINDTTWLHVPYWCAFGSEYYRIDDSLRVWDFSLTEGTPRILFDLGKSGRTGDVGLAVCGEARDVIWDFDTPPRIETPRHWSYAEMDGRDEPDPFNHWYFATGWTTTPYCHAEPTDSVFAYAMGMCCPSPAYAQVFGIDGPASSRFHQGFAKQATGIWSTFRQKSTADWPAMSDVWVAVRRSPVRVAFALSTAPNPFNPSTTIRYDLPEASHVRLSIYDITGRHVRALVDAYTAAGTHAVVWDGTDASGRAVASGVHLVRLVSAGRSPSGESHRDSQTNQSEATVRRVTLVR